MPDQSAVYIGTAFVAGVGLALVCKEVLSFQRSQENSATQEPASDALSARPGPPAIVEGIEGCIGNTPLFRIKSLSDATGCEILGKAEFLNGAGQSSKDRVALSMIELAEDNDILTPYSGDTIYEGTSGSTGISLATLARAKGYLAHMYALQIHRSMNSLLTQPQLLTLRPSN
jgi:cysteine synthase A